MRVHTRRMGLDSRDYMREVPIYRQLLGRGKASGGSGGGAGKPPTAWDDPPHEPQPWRSTSIGHHKRRTRTRPWAWFLLGVFVTIAMVGVVTNNVPSAVADALDRPTRGAAATPQTPAALPPGTVAVVGGVPAIGPPLRLRIGGRETVTVGTLITVRGPDPDPARRDRGREDATRRRRVANDPTNACSSGRLVPGHVPNLEPRKDASPSRLSRRQLRVQVVPRHMSCAS